jgi:hypothetical protein
VVAGRESAAGAGSSTQPDNKAAAKKAGSSETNLVLFMVYFFEALDMKASRMKSTIASMSP